MAVKPENPVVGGTVLRRAAIQSPNFVTGVSGWTIRQDGSAEFNNLTVRGGVIISSTSLIYSGPPALGNLVESDGFTVLTTDAQGNTVLPGRVTYNNIAGTMRAVQINQDSVSFVTAPSPGGLYSGQAALTVGGSANVLQVLTGAFKSQAGTAANPTVITTDTPQVMTPLLNGWANVAGFAVAQYQLLATRKVEVIAHLSAAAATAATFFTLPAAYRPLSQQAVGAAGASGNVPAGLAPWCRVDTSGNLTVQNTGAVGAAWQFFVHGYISLDA